MNAQPVNEGEQRARQKGSSFSFSLLMEGDSNIPTIREVVLTAPSDLKDRAIHVLLVEDNRINQIVASNFLTKWGITVDVANNGGEAVEMVTKNIYNVILMDIQMPVMDGYEAAMRIRAMDAPYFKNIPIIALTASAMLGVRDKVMEVGMNDYIAKPFVPADLQAAIRKYTFSGEARSRRLDSLLILEI